MQNSRPRKICFFDFATLNYGGGCEINFMNLGKYLVNKGYETSFITATYFVCSVYCNLSRQGKHTQNFSKYELEEKFLVKNYTQFRFVDLIFITKNKRKILNELEQSDVIYSKNEIFEVLILKYFFRVDMSKVVFGFHTPIFYPSTRNLKSKLHNLLYNSSFYFKLIENTKIRYLVLSERDNLLLKEKNFSNVTVIPNPLNTTKFRRDNYQKKHSFNIYYIGRMTEQKGVDTLAHVIKNLASTDIFLECKFFFVGNGDQENYFIDISNKYSNCFFIGFKKDILEYYRDADLVVVPSRAESFCYTVAEAQSCGVPVLCSDIPGPKDIIIPNVTGWLVGADNIQGFVDGIKNAYQIWNKDFSSYQDMGRLARVNILKNYKEEEINSKIETFMFKK